MEKTLGNLGGPPPERQRRRWRTPPAGGSLGRQVALPSWGFLGLYLYDRRLTYT